MDVMRRPLRTHLIEERIVEVHVLVVGQVLAAVAPRGSLDVQCLSDGLVHRDEAAIVGEIGDRDVASLLQLAEGSVMPGPGRIIFQCFVPPCHVQVAADDVHEGPVPEVLCLVKGGPTSLKPA